MLEADRIETPENVILERRLAGIGSRFLAGFVDNLILIGFYLLIVAFLLILTPFSYSSLQQVNDELTAWALALVIVLIFAVYWGYFVVMEYVMNGQTIGKRRVKIRVVKENGSAISFLDIAIRNLLRVVDGQFGYLAAGICMFFTRRSQRLGDLAAGTVMVIESGLEYAAQPDSAYDRVEWELEMSPESLEECGLTPDEFKLLHNFWVRRSHLNGEARERILPRLLNPILEKHGIVLKDDRYYTRLRYLEDLMNKAINAPKKPGAEP